LDQRLTTIPQHTWVRKLFGYDFQVEYHPRKFNIVANALSRCHEEVLHVHALSTTIFEAYDTLWQELIHLQAIQLRAQLHDQTAPPGWTDVDGILMFQGRAWLPYESALWPAVLEHAHTMGHEVRKPCITYVKPSIVRMCWDLVAKGC
jgi:hypothetical protein